MNTAWVGRNVDVTPEQLTARERESWRRLFRMDQREALTLAMYGILLYRIRNHVAAELSGEELVVLLQLFAAGILYEAYPHRPLFCSSVPTKPECRNAA